MRPLLFASLFLALPALAQSVYSWEDKTGVHYTDDPTRVPRGVTVEVMVVDAVPAAVAAVQPAVRPHVAPAQAELNEREWRDKFVTAYRRIATLKQRISALEGTMPLRTECLPQTLPTPVGTTQPSGAAAVTPVVRCQVNPLHDQLRVQVARLHVKLKDAEVDLQALERQASYDAVPREWRREW